MDLDTLNLWAPFPAGAALAILPAGIIRRRPLVGLLACAVAAVGWLVCPVLGIMGLSAGLVMAVRSGRGKKSSRAFRSVVAAVLPPVGAVAVLEWVNPGSTGAFGWLGRHPSALAVVSLAVLVLGLILRRALRPKLDPVRHATPAMRQEVIDRDGDRCNYCGAEGDALGVQLAMDHVIPWAAGGRTISSNMQLLCPPCNSLKSDHSDREARRMFKAVHGFAAGSFPKNWFERIIK